MSYLANEAARVVEEGKLQRIYKLGSRGIRSERVDYGVCARLGGQR